MIHTALKWLTHRLINAEYQKEDFFDHHFLKGKKSNILSFQLYKVRVWCFCWHICQCTIYFATLALENYYGHILHIRCQSPSHPIQNSYHSYSKKKCKCMYAARRMPNKGAFRDDVKNRKRPWHILGAAQHAQQNHNKPSSRQWQGSSIALRINFLSLPRLLSFAASPRQQSPLSRLSKDESAFRQTQNKPLNKHTHTHTHNSGHNKVWGHARPRMAIALALAR